MAEVDTAAEMAEAEAAAREPHAAVKFEYPSQIYAWYVVAVLVLAYTFSFIDRQILSLLVGPMKRDLQISDFEMSLLQGFAFAIFYTLMGLPIGRMVDSYNRVRIITIGVAVWSLMTALCGISRSYMELFLYRMGVGVGEAALSPAAYSMLSDSFRPERIGVAIGVYGTGVYIGAGLALVIGAQVVELASVAGTTTLPLVGEVFPWQLVFIAVGLPGLLVALWVLTLREPKRHGATQMPPLADVFAYMKANKTTLICHNLCYAFSAMMGYGVAAWIPEFMIRTHGWSASEIGSIYGWIIAIFGTLGVVAGGYLGDFLAKRRRNGRMLMLALTGILTLPFAVAAPLVGNANLAVLLLIPATFFATFTTGGGPSAIQELMPNKMRGMVSAIMLFVVNIIGLGLGPSAIAFMTDFILQDESQLRYSIAVVPAVLLALSSIFGFAGMKAYLRSRDNRDQYELENQ
ncbi:spinster family MFS transporter [Tepidicaulis sp. LMO-SS28]|uniref:spinster family MFS transporter n=1 Tax=Tepidicaulis sp. LMO-SS28 TaxID=3447455 RepID=UPI003EE08365